MGRAFAIGFYEEGANQFGFRSILSDQDGALLWEFSYAVDTTDENHWWFSERTLFDEMTMEHRSGLDFTDEIYTINGVSQTFHFNTSDVDELKTLHRDLLGADKKQMQNMLSSSSINDVATILVLKEFDSFYDGDNSLHYNNDGALVIQWCPTTAWPAGLAPSTWVATTNHFSVPAGPIGFVCPLPYAPPLNALC